VPIFKEIIGLKSGIMPIWMVPFFGSCQLLTGMANLNIYVNDP